MYCKMPRQGKIAIDQHKTLRKRKSAVVIDAIFLLRLRQLLPRQGRKSLEMRGSWYALRDAASSRVTKSGAVTGHKERCSHGSQRAVQTRYHMNYVVLRSFITQQSSLLAKYPRLRVPDCSSERERGCVRRQHR